MNNTMTRTEIDDQLQWLEEQLAGSTEGDELQTYMEGTQIFHDLDIGESDRNHLAERLAEIRRRYRLD